MKYTIDKKDSYTTITIEEKKLDTTVAPDLKSEFVKLNAEGINNLILDLSNVKYTDSSGLSSILIANRLCNSTGGVLVLVDSVQPIDEPDLARLLEAFPAYFHEPYYSTYAETDLPALFSGAGLRLIDQDQAFLTKALLLEKPA